MLQIHLRNAQSRTLPSTLLAGKLKIAFSRLHCKSSRWNLRFCNQCANGRLCRIESLGRETEHVVVLDHRKYDSGVITVMIMLTLLI